MRNEAKGIRGGGKGREDLGDWTAGKAKKKKKNKIHTRGKVELYEETEKNFEVEKNER